MTTKATWLKLGIVGRAHGLRGSFFVSARDEPIPASVHTVRIGDNPSELADIKIENRLWQSGRPVLKCDVASDRTSAELLTGKPLWCESSQVKVDDADEYLLSDMLNRKVLDANQITVGIVEDVYLAASGVVNLVVFDESRNADIEIPMIGAYVNMNFKRNESTLNLAVAAEVFAEIWNDRGKKK